MKILNVIKNDSVVGELYIETDESELNALGNWLEKEYGGFFMAEDEDGARNFYVDGEEGIFTLTENI